MKLELRYLFDCEKLEKILQFRYNDGTYKTPWQDVPTHYAYDEEPKVTDES